MQHTKIQNFSCDNSFFQSLQMLKPPHMNIKKISQAIYDRFNTHREPK